MAGMTEDRLKEIEAQLKDTPVNTIRMIHGTEYKVETGKFYTVDLVREITSELIDEIRRLQEALKLAYADKEGYVNTCVTQSKRIVQLE